MSDIELLKFLVSAFLGLLYEPVLQKYSAGAVICYCCCLFVIIPCNMLVG